MRSNGRTGLLESGTLSRRLCLGVCLIFALTHILFFHNKFFDINRSKYCLFAYGMYAAVLPVGACLILEALRSRNVGRPRLATWGMLLLLASAGVSVLLASDRMTALTGSGGRLAGGIFFGALGILYACGLRACAAPEPVAKPGGKAAPQAARRRRMPEPAALLACALLVSGSLCAALGILNFLDWDPLDFYTSSLPEVYHSDFISTIGNINFFSACMCPLAALAAGLYVRGQGRGRLLALPPFLLCFMGVLAGHSNSGMAGLAALGLAALAFPSRIQREAARLLVLPGSACAAAGLLGLIAAARGGQTMDFSDSVAHALLTAPGLTFPCGAVLLGAAALLFFRPERSAVLRWFNRVRKAALACAGLGLAAVVALMIYYTRVAPSADVPSALLRMDDNWGTFRGNIWRKTVSVWRELPLHQKLFGVGPECYGALLESCVTTR